ncbi:toxin 23 [Marivirga sericea]|uniref:Toxin 23 n=2 Tax=Marivirga sericea TaxID=1028 RepID=A0A1X7ISE3_9BACT|nr:toxin 23 [Marivirga sericea]
MKPKGWLALIVILLFSVISLFPPNSYAQEKSIKNGNLSFYVRAGISLQIGSHQNRLGSYFSSSIGKSYANLTIRYDLLYTFQDLGFYEKSFQQIVGVKWASAFQQYSTIYRPYIDSPFSNDHFYEFHYFYRYYFNKWNTKQPTGELGLNFGHFFILHENDLLAAKSVDKFRTAAIRIGYQDSVQSIATSFIFWTGNKDHPNTKRINSSSFSRYGYFDLSDTPYGKYSHGILAIDYARQLPFGNQLALSAGYDHEMIRNVIQNKFMHDLPIWPKKWNTAKSRHVPMIDQNGDAFLYEEDQKLRQAKVYWGIFFNSPEFY